MTFTVDQTGTIAYDGGVAAGWTFRAGTYYPDEVATELASALTAGAGADVEVSIDDGARGTGQLTISAGATIAIVFTATPLRNGISFTGNLAAATSHTAPAGIQGMWIPGCTMISPDLTHKSTGVLRRDTMQVANRGHVWDWPSQSWRSFLNVQFRLVEEGRAVEGVSTVLRSWEEFIRVCLSDTSSLFPHTTFQTPAVRVIFDADADEVLGNAAGGDGLYRLILDPEASSPMPTEGYPGLRTVEIAEMRKVP